MCGILGFISKFNINIPHFIKLLDRLSYRGYDSAGIYYNNEIVKKQGRISNLNGYSNNPQNIIIGHTRWATHGKPIDINSHPHKCNDGSIVLVHNGIIENYMALKTKLMNVGYHFESETDTEVLVNWIHYCKKLYNLDNKMAIRNALLEVDGTYGLVIKFVDEDKLYAIRNSSPLCLGIADNSYYISSDKSTFIDVTKDVIYLNDNELLVLNEDSYEIMDINNEQIVPDIIRLKEDIQQIEKGNYDHFMLKEIMEQPTALNYCLQGRIINDKVKLGGIHNINFNRVKRIIICACGTSYHAGLIGRTIIENISEIPVIVEQASEFRYRRYLHQEGDLVLLISQSGETADTIEGLKIAKKHGVQVMSICNVVGSSLARLASQGIYLHLGPEIGVASTKAFSGQVCILILLACYIAQEKDINDADRIRILRSMGDITKYIDDILGDKDMIYKLAKNFRFAQNFIFLGRKLNYPIALEGALKLKEISYIHAEGFSASELKHGPIALINPLMPTLIIIPQDSVYEKTKSNLLEVYSRNGILVIITNKSNHELDDLSDYIIRIPDNVEEEIIPILSVIPLQLFAYYVGILRGCDVDKPRNLAKSVTVE